MLFEKVENIPSSLQKNHAVFILENDPELSKPEHEKMRERIRKIMKSKPDWSRVGWVFEISDFIFYLLSVRR